MINDYFGVDLIFPSCLRSNSRGKEGLLSFIAVQIKKGEVPHPAMYLKMQMRLHYVKCPREHQSFDEVCELCEPAASVETICKNQICIVLGLSQGKSTGNEQEYPKHLLTYRSLQEIPRQQVLSDLYPHLNQADLQALTESLASVSRKDTTEDPIEQTIRHSFILDPDCQLVNFAWKWRPQTRQPAAASRTKRPRVTADAVNKPLQQQTETDKLIEKHFPPYQRECNMSVIVLQGIEHFSTVIPEFDKCRDVLTKLIDPQSDLFQNVVASDKEKMLRALSSTASPIIPALSESLKVARGNQATIALELTPEEEELQKQVNQLKFAYERDMKKISQ